jgi:hypothetical protein
MLGTKVITGTGSQQYRHYCYGKYQFDVDRNHWAVLKKTLKFLSVTDATLHLRSHVSLV